jgi:hypothetical protein
VVSISVLAFTFGFKDATSTKLHAVNGLALPISIIVVNLFAIGYSLRGFYYMTMHRKRTKEVLCRYAADLAEISNSNSMGPKTELTGKINIQSYLHAFLIIVALIPLVIYLTGGWFVSY